MPIIVSCKVQDILYSAFNVHSEDWQVQFSYSVMSESLQPHGLWHTRLPCPSQTPKACSNLCPSGQ